MKKIFVCVVALLLSHNMVYAQLVSEDQAVYDRMDRMERDLTLLQRKIYKNPQAQDIPTDPVIIDSQPTVSAGSLEHLYIKISDLEQTIASLTAQVEDLSHSLSQTQEELKKVNLDVNAKLSEMNKKVASVKTEASPSKPAEKKKEDGNDKLSSKQLYDSAYQLLNEQKYAQAQVAFEDFLKKYPNDALAGNAQYWLGETFYVRQLYEPAAVAFANGVKTYKKSAKGPDCLFKLGLTMKQLNKNTEACTAFRNMKKEFPQATESLLTRSTKEIEKLGCSK